MRAWVLLKPSSRTIMRSARYRWAAVFRGAPAVFPGSKLAVTACRRRMRLTFFSGHTNPSSNIALTHALMGQCKGFMPCANRCRTVHCLEDLWNISETAKTKRLKVRSWNPWNGRLRSFYGRPTLLGMFRGVANLLSHYNRGLALFISCKF